MTKNLKYIFFISCIVAILFPLTTIYLIFPSFKTVLVDNIEDEAVRVAKHFSPIVVSVSGDELKNRDEFAVDLQMLAQQFNIKKIKVFTKSGEVIYSSSPEEIGTINNKSFFHEIVAKGEVYAEVVTKDKESASDTVVTTDVVETYIPIMANSTFIGAFEIYYDITDKLQTLNNVAIRLLKISIILMLIFLISISIIAIKSDREITGISISPLGRKRYRSAVYNISMMAAFLFFGNAIVMLVIHPLEISSSIFEAFFNATLLMLLISPALYFFMVQPLLEHISERKKTEMELRETKQMLEDIAQGITENILVLSKDYKVLWANKTALLESGFSIEEIYGDYCFRVTHHREQPCEPPHDRCPVQDVLKTGASIIYEHIHFDKNNNQRYVEVSAYPITDDEGNIIKFIHISRDISKRKQLEQERERLISELKESFENIKTLKGLIPICASCKKIRDDEGFWSQVETYISEHSDAQFSHGICPDCMKELYPEYL